MTQGQRLTVRGMRFRFLLTGLLVLSALLSPAVPQAADRRPQASPSRVISLVPSVTEMIFAMGAGDSVVGVSSFDRFPPEALTRTAVGGLLDPDFERILSLRPDLVVVYASQAELIDRLSRAGIPAFEYQHAGLADITRTMREIGARLGHGGAAERLAAEIERRTAAIRARTQPLPKPRTMMVFERETGSLRSMFGSGGVGFLHDMLEVAGGVNVFAGVPREGLQITTEVALTRAPEVILEIRSGPDWTSDRIARERGAWRVLPAVPAVRDERIYFLTHELMSIPGPRVVDAILAMARVLHPGASLD